MRERLIELIQDSVDGCARHWAEIIAEGILADGWIRPPCKVGDEVYFLAKSTHTKLEKVKSGKVARMAIVENGIDLFVNNYVSKLPFGKRSFLTKEEAENALKERERV